MVSFPCYYDQFPFSVVVAESIFLFRTMVADDDEVSLVLWKEWWHEWPASIDNERSIIYLFDDQESRHKKTMISFGYEKQRLF